MPLLPADFTHARPCKPFCEKFLTLPHERTESTSFTGQFVRLDPPLFLPSQSYAGTYQSMTIFTIIYISKTVSEHMTDTVLLNTLLIL